MYKAQHFQLEFPYRYTITPSTLKNWKKDSKITWEDWNGPEEGHPYGILCRYNTFIEFNDTEEVKVMQESAEQFGSSPLNYRYRYKHTLKGISNELLELLDLHK
jgi:hypothetical protein